MASMGLQRIRKKLEEQLEFPTRFGTPKGMTFNPNHFYKSDMSEFAQAVSQVIENSYWNGCVLRLDGAIRLAKL